MKKLLFLLLFGCVSFLSAQNYTSYGISTGYVCGGDYISPNNPLTVGLNFSMRNNTDMYLVNTGLPIVDVSYINFGLGKFISPNVYVAGLLGMCFTKHGNKTIYPSGGAEIGININNINLSTSYTLINTKTGIVSLKIGYIIN